MKCSLGAVHPHAGPTNPLRARPPVRRQAGTRGGTRKRSSEGGEKTIHERHFRLVKARQNCPLGASIGPLRPRPSRGSGHGRLAQRVSVAPRAQPTPAGAGLAETAMRVFADRKAAYARAVDARGELSFEL